MFHGYVFCKSSKQMVVSGESTSKADQKGKRELAIGAPLRSPMANMPLSKTLQSAEKAN